MPPSDSAAARPPTLTGEVLSTSPVPATALDPSPDVDPAARQDSCTALSVARGPLPWHIDNFSFQARYYSTTNLHLNGGWQIAVKPPTWPMPQPRWYYPWGASGWDGLPAPMLRPWSGEEGWEWKANWASSFKARAVHGSLVETDTGDGNRTGVAYVEMVGVWYCDDRDPSRP